MKSVDSMAFRSFATLSSLRISKGGLIALIAFRIDRDNDGYFSTVYIIDREGGRGRPIATTAGVRWFDWLDEDSLAMLASPEDGGTGSVLFRVDITTGEKTELVRLEMEAVSAAPAGDGFIFLSSPRVSEDLCTVLDFDPPNPRSSSNSRLYHYNGGILRPLSPESLNVLGFSAGPVGEGGCFRLAYHAQGYRDEAKYESRLFIQDLPAGQAREISAGHGVRYACVRVLEDGSIMVARNDKHRYGEYQDEALEFLDRDGKMTSRLNGDSFYHLFNDICTDICYGEEFIVDCACRGEDVYFLATVGSCCEIIRGNRISGILEPATDLGIRIIDFSLRGREIVMIAMEGLHGPEVLSFDMDTVVLTRLSSFNRASEMEYSWSIPERCDFTASDGTGIEGWLLKPPAVDPDKRYPGILHIHGGPNVAYGPFLFHEMQYLAASGFAVFYCNPRGSAGRGGDFQDIRRRYGTVDYDDLMEFVDSVLLKHQWIDPDRLGVTGGSYGGFMTNWIIGHTDRFRAAASDRGTAEHTCDFLLTDIGRTFIPDTYGTTPWEDHGSLWKESPLCYADRVKTPTLFLHGGSDARCNCEQSLLMFSALRCFNVATRLMVFNGEGHDVSREGKPSSRIRRLEALESWFHNFLIVDCHTPGDPSNQPGGDGEGPKIFGRDLPAAAGEGLLEEF